MDNATERSLRMLVARSSVGPNHVPLNLANQNLEMVKLPYVDLRGADLSGANLRGAMLWGACLESACLDGADLTCSDLTCSSLAGASLGGALLVEAELDETTVDVLGLGRAVTAGADMTTITFTAGFFEALRRSSRARPGDIEALKAAETAILEPHRRTAPLSLRARGAAGFGISQGNGFTGDWYEYKQDAFRRANVRVLSDADLQELLSWSSTARKPLNLRGCNLSGANLRGARLDGACLAWADLTGADVRGASFAGADKTESYGW